MPARASRSLCALSSGPVNSDPSPSNTVDIEAISARRIMTRLLGRDGCLLRLQAGDPGSGADPVSPTPTISLEVRPTVSARTWRGHDRHGGIGGGGLRLAAHAAR